MSVFIVIMGLVGALIGAYVMICGACLPEAVAQEMAKESGGYVNKQEMEEAKEKGMTVLNIGFLIAVVSLLTMGFVGTYFDTRETDKKIIEELGGLKQLEVVVTENATGKTAFTFKGEGAVTNHHEFKVLCMKTNNPWMKTDLEWKAFDMGRYGIKIIEKGE